MARDPNELHLADLHERAADAGIPGYRMLRREELVEALEARPSEAAPESEPVEPDEADTDEIVIEATVLDDKEQTPVELGPLGAEGGDERADELPTEDVRGVLELTRQGYGFLRLEGLTPSDDDVYVSAAQVRRCALRPGDEVSGPAREPRRGERHRALVHVDTGRRRGAERGPPRVRRACPGVCPSGGSRSTAPVTTCSCGRSTCSRRSPSASGSWSGRLPGRGVRRCCARSPAPPPGSTPRG